MKNKYYLWIAGLLAPACSMAQPGLFAGDKAAVTAPARPHEISITMAVRPYISIDLFGNEDDHTVFNPEIDIAYSPSTRVSFTGSYRALVACTLPASRAGSLYQPSDKLSGYRAELGLLYNYPLSDKGFVNAGAGYLHGTLNNKTTVPYHDAYLLSNDISRDFSGTYNGGFLQAALGFQTKYIRLAGGLKYSLVKYQSFDYANSTYEASLPGTYHEQAIAHRLNGYIQPYFDFSVGGRLVKFNFQTGFLFHTDDTIDKRLYCSLGLLVMFGVAK